MYSFIHHEFPELIQINENNTRIYLTSSGSKYPSVTSVTGFGSEQYINEWRNRIGHEEADKISARAANRGSRINKLCEDFLKGNVINVDMVDQEIWKQMKQVLNNINNIHCLETRLYSNILKVAGTVDLVAEYNGQLSIIDWKTSGRLKTIDNIDGYMSQCSAYAQCFEELTNIPVDNLVVVIGTDDQTKASVFVESKNKWLKKFKKKRYLFYKHYKL